MSKYAVIDLEMCNVPPNANGKFFAIRNEIIQIGAVLVDEEQNVIDSFSTLVSPQYGRIDKFIHRLTRISQKDTEGAPTIAEAVGAFLDWLPEDAVIVSWSDSDEAQIRNELNFKKILIPQLAQYFQSWLDCQKLFAERMNAGRKQYRLSEALILAAIDYEEGAHDALVDARNTAKLFAKLQSNEPVQCIAAYYSSAESVKPATHNPFADLLADVLFAG